MIDKFAIVRNEFRISISKSQKSNTNGKKYFFSLIKILSRRIPDILFAINRTFFELLILGCAISETEQFIRF